MHRFHFDPADVSDDNVVVLSKEESRHAVKVLRLGPGDVVELMDGRENKFRGVVVSAANSALTVSIDRTAHTRGKAAAKAEVVLAAAVIRTERMEFLIQKACELGATKIVPLLAARSIVKLPRERWAEKIRRWQKIAAESCKQCGRVRVPSISVPVSLSDFLKTVPASALFLFPTLAAQGKTLQEAFHERPLKTPTPPSIILAVGPEGDFTAEETGRALDRGAIPITLGETVLRSETAALYLLSVTRFIYAQAD